jgi:hypothetical protein
MLIRSLPRRGTRWLPEIGLAALLSTALAGTAFALTSDRGSVIREQPERLAGDPLQDLRGAPGSQILQSSVPVPGIAARVRALSVGVMTYTSEAGQLCFSTGPVRAGRVGRVTESAEFYALDAGDAPGPCGDNRENFLVLGGIAFSHVSRSELDADAPQPIIYGAVADLDTAVRVTWPRGETTRATVRAAAKGTDLQGGAGTFLAAGPIGQVPDGARVTLLRPDGTVIHVFDL